MGLYEQLSLALKEENRGLAMEVCLTALDEKTISIMDLYQDILSPALNSIIQEYDGDEDNLIWKEHVRSGIIRGIIEASYPFVLKEAAEIGREMKESVIVMCPRYEEHEIGARMVSDFYTIAGYKSTFIGANTPEKTILKAIETIRPGIISISVTNYYNLVALKKTIDEIKNNFNYPIKFVVGGYAFNKNINAYKEVGADIQLKSFKDVLDLDKGVENSETST